MLFSEVQRVQEGVYFIFCNFCGFLINDSFLYKAAGVLQVKTCLFLIG